MENTNTQETPNTPKELLERQEPKKLTPQELMESFLELTYEEQDNFIFQLLKGTLGFHKFLLSKSEEGDKKLPNTLQLMRDVTKLEVISSLYQEVE